MKLKDDNCPSCDRKLILDFNYNCKCCGVKYNPAKEVDGE